MLNLTRTQERRELAEFLLKRRARTRPEDVGLVSGPRRRTPGLRREEVAQIAGVGVTWYTWFEQGRDISVSADFLERLCRGLQFTTAERMHLFALAHHRPPPESGSEATRVSDVLRATVESLPNPAYLKTTRWDVLAWNTAATAMFGDFGSMPPERRNTLWLVFNDPYYRRMMIDWEGDARRVLAKFRLDYGRANGDPAFDDLIRSVGETSAEFHQWWSWQDVSGHGEGVKRLRHDRLGEIEFEHVTFALEGEPGLRLVIYTPASPEDVALARALVSG